MSVHATYREQRRKADAAKAAAEWDRRCEAMGVRRAAERLAEERSRRAAADEARAANLAGMTPIERAAYLDAEATFARWRAERAAATPNHQEPSMTVNAETMNALAERTRAENAAKAEAAPLALAQAADAKAKEAAGLDEAARIDPTEGNRYAALVAFAEAARAKAKAAFAAVSEKATQAVRDAEHQAGDDPIARAKARAATITKHADALGRAEVEAERAELAYDQAVVETAKVCKLAEHRIRSVKAHLADAEAKAKANPHALGNPYHVEPPTLMDWQFASLPPAMQRKAMEDGARIVDDPAPPFTKAEAASILRMRGSSREVLTRAEFAALGELDKVKAARRCILLDH